MAEMDELRESLGGGAGVEHLPRQRQPRRQILGQIGRIQGSGGVDQDDVARWPRLTREHLPQQAQAGLRIRHAQRVERGVRQAELDGIEPIFVDEAIAQLGDVRGRGDADLIQPVLGMDHQHVTAAQRLQHLGQRAHPVRRIDADQLAGHRAGLVKGPSRLNTVRTPSSRRIWATWRVA